MEDVFDVDVDVVDADADASACCGVLGVKPSARAFSSAATSSDFSKNLTVLIP